MIARHACQRRATPSPLRTLLAVILLAALPIALPGPALHAQEDGDGDDAAASPTERLDAAVQQLIAEAQDLDEFGEDRVPAVFKRPHPTMADWPADMALPALHRMGREFTGNEYRDTYIRWHLIWMAKDLMRQAMQRYRATGVHELPEGISDRLLTLLRAMPGPVEREGRDDDRYEGPVGELRRWKRIAEVRIGYPPFDQVHEGRAALPYVTGERRAEIEHAIEQIERLSPLVRHIVDPEARAYNSRIRDVNAAIRQYRGDLIYALIQTGDEPVLLLAIEEIARQVQEQRGAAFDLMRYMYLAAFDGYLMLYEPATFERAGRALKRIAEAADAYRTYGSDREARNFAEYAFHMVHLLADPDAMRWFHREVTVGDLPERTRPADFQYTPYNFTMADIRAARQRAVHRIHNPGSDRLASRLTPHYELTLERMRHLQRIRQRGRGSEEQETVHEFGNQALIAWAMMAGGESFQDPRLFKRLNWALTADTSYTFDRGMRLQMLAQMPYERWRPWINRDTRWITSALSDKGNWGYQYTGGESTTWGDHANGAYGVLGLWGAQRAGMEIPLAAWRAVDQHWRATQQATAGNAPAGWAVAMLNVDTGDEQATGTGANEFYTRVSGPMTAAGVATLTLTERYLYGPERADPDDENVSTHLQKGIDWLDQNFAITSDDPSADWFYYMWTMQRVGQATGYRSFNSIDWFRDVTAEMLNRQQDNGLWEDPDGNHGPLVSTGFALLYLGNAYAPIAVSKVRFDGKWNNRPHDLWNFVDHASDQYEVETGWQIVELDQPIYQLIESPILYIASDEYFELPAPQVDRLRAYIHAGGLLVLNPDEADAGVQRAFRQLTEQLFPNLEMQDVPTDHAFYDIHEKLRPSVRMRMMHNGVRPMVVQFVRDIGEGLQTYDIGRSGSFSALNNLYLHSVSLNPRRSRLEQSYIVAEPSDAADADRSIKIARLTHGGTHDPEPAALPQLQALMARDHGVNVQLETIDPTALSNQRLAFLTTIGDAELSDAQAQAIRDWLERGGTLWLDAAGGSQQAADDASELLQQIAPDRTPTRLGASSPIITGQGLPDGVDGFDNRRVEYRYYALREMGPVTRPRLQAVHLDDRPAIIYSPEDITTALAGMEQWGLFGYSIDSARQLAVNSVLHALDADPGSAAAR